MVSVNDLKQSSFLVYGLGLTGKSVINFFKKNKIKNYQVWDDKDKKSFKNRRPLNLTHAIKRVNHVVLSPGVSLKKSINRKVLIKYKQKIITDIDLVFLLKNFFKSIVVTGTNGKSTTCKIISHVLKKNNFKVSFGGNIGTPILNLNLKKNHILIIEASSFQLEYSKFVKPDYAILLNITNDHLDWHGNMQNYVNAKFNIFKNQKKKQYSLINKSLTKKFKNRNLSGKLIVPSIEKYKKFKHQIKNSYLSLPINDENMSNVFTLSRIFKINDEKFIKSLNSFRGLPHRYEIFLKKKKCLFINDSKATSFEATKFALKNSKNIFWILGGLPKKKDKIILRNLKNNIIRCYLIGKNINFFKKQLQNKVTIHISKNLKNSVIRICKDVRLFGKKNNIILLSPAAASFDQFLNFEKRGEEFKKLSRHYARKFL